MKTLVSFLVCLLVTLSLFSQNYESMTEGENVQYESFEASYSARFIKNRKTQDVYDVEVSIKNNGHDFIKLKKVIGETEYNLKPYGIAELRFGNATGSNLTVKDGFVLGEMINHDVSFECADCNGGKDDVRVKTDRFLVGYGIRRGQVVDATFRIRVPKDEKPEVEIRFRS